MEHVHAAGSEVIRFGLNAAADAWKPYCVPATAMRMLDIAVVNTALPDTRSAGTGTDNRTDLGVAAPMVQVGSLCEPRRMQPSRTISFACSRGAAGAGFGRGIARC
jgi:hypothetical protein